MSHPSLGAPPPSMTAGFPAAAARIRAAGPRLAARALEIAIERDPTIRERYDEPGLRKLLHDTTVFTGEVAKSMAANDPRLTAAWAEWLAPVYRRRKVPMDDLAQLADGLRLAVGAVIEPSEQPTLHAAIDEAIAVFRWHRRLAGDARRRNKLLAFLYKGA